MYLVKQAERDAGPTTVLVRSAALTIVVSMALAVLAADATAAQPERGVDYQAPALNYLQHCAGCHRPDGAGSARNDVPDMRHVIGHFARLDDGRAFLIQVAGVAQAPLPAPDLAALMNWLLSQFSAAELPADFVPYSAREVDALLASRPADLPAIRAALVEQLGALGHDVPDYPNSGETAHQ